MTICRYYLEGRCMFGNNCKNEHRQPSSGGYNQFNDRGGSLQTRLGYAAHNQKSGNKPPQPPPYEEKGIRYDLRGVERPQYKFSVYGPGKEEPNLIEGTDFSSEELRVEYYQRRGGAENQYHTEVRRLQNEMENKIQSVLKDIRGAIRNFENKKRQEQQSSGFGGGSGNNGFGYQAQQQPPLQQPQQSLMQQNNSTPSSFGAPAPVNLFNATNNAPIAFGTPATPMNSGGGMFGLNTSGFEMQQPQNSTPGFGAPMGDGGSGGGFGRMGGITPVAAGGGNTLGLFNSGGLFQSSQQQPLQNQPQLLLQQQQQQQQQLLMLQQQQQQQQQQQPQNNGQLPGANNPLNPPQPITAPSDIPQWQLNAYSSPEFDMYMVPDMPPPPSYPQ